MEWTAEKPTIPGWYWWRMSPHARESVIQITHMDMMYNYYPLCREGEWAGPVSQPEEVD